MLKLKGYLITLAVGYIIVFLVNMLLSIFNVSDFSILFSFYYPLLIILTFFALDLLSAILFRLVPKKSININSKLFKTFKFERKFYEALGVRWFKDKIPELGGALKGFSKSEIKTDEQNYIEEFIKETILGELTHWFCIIFGIAIFFIFTKSILTFALPLFLLNTYFNILPVIVQRYNRPKLQNIYNRKNKKEVKENDW